LFKRTGQNKNKPIGYFIPNYSTIILKL